MTKQYIDIRVSKKGKFDKWLSNICRLGFPKKEILMDD